MSKMTHAYRVEMDLLLDKLFKQIQYDAPSGDIAAAWQAVVDHWEKTKGFEEAPRDG